MKKSPRTLKGVVVSDKMNLTAVVAVEKWRRDPRYLKYARHTSRFKAHNQENQYKAGDRVVIQETRPLSKEKRWKIIGKL